MARKIETSAREYGSGETDDKDGLTVARGGRVFDLSPRVTEAGYQVEEWYKMMLNCVGECPRCKTEFEVTEEHLDHQKIGHERHGLVETVGAIVLSKLGYFRHSADHRLDEQTRSNALRGDDGYPYMGIVRCIECDTSVSHAETYHFDLGVRMSGIA